MPEWQALFSALHDCDVNVSTRDMPRPVSGGDTSAAWRMKAKNNSVFVKTGPASSYQMFLAEAEGLKELRKACAIRVPTVLGCVSSARDCLLALEWVDFDLPQKYTEALLGQQLAMQHQYCSKQFGWHRDNTIGKTPQHNPLSGDWVTFFTEHRLAYQLRLATENGYDGELQKEGDLLLNNVGSFFHDYWPEASLLHGDLWGGNWASVGGEPVVFDPAVYYGDRESDIAMTKLFGGFGDEFYSAYEEVLPIAAGSKERMLLYQLYHVLNHLNLFGAAYYGRAVNLIRQLL